MTSTRRACAFRVSRSSFTPVVLGSCFEEGAKRQSMIPFKGRVHALLVSSGLPRCRGHCCTRSSGSENVEPSGIKGRIRERRPTLAYLACIILMPKITHPTLNRIRTAGSPSARWLALENIYAPPSAAETARLTQSWYKLSTREGNPQKAFSERHCTQEPE